MNLTTEYLDSIKGRLRIDYCDFSRRELADIAHTLNNWNANQPISDSEHNSHYIEFVHPIHEHLEKRLNTFMEKNSNEGSWRTHILVKCVECQKLMGHHKESSTAVCVDCEKQHIINKQR